MFEIDEFDSLRGLRRPLGIRFGEGSGDDAPGNGEESGDERGNGIPLKDGDPRRLMRNLRGGRGASSLSPSLYTFFANIGVGRRTGSGKSSSSDEELEESSELDLM